MKNMKKVMPIVIMLIVIIAGAIVVGVKGFNVSLYLREHDTLEYFFDTTYEKSDVKEIAKEVFEDKNFEIRPVEVFDDAVYIIAEDINDEEETALLEKLSDLYADEEVEEVETEESDEEETIYDKLDEGTDYNFYHDSNIRLRDLLKPYVTPTIIVAVIVLICLPIRYAILKFKNIAFKTIETVVKSVFLVLFLLSIVAIFRIPVNAWILPVMMFAVLLFLIAYFEYEIRGKNEKNN